VISLSSPADQEILDTIRNSCRASDGTDPLDEATSLRLKNHGLATSDQLWLDGSDGFALALAMTETSTDLTLAVRPDARGRGRGHRLLAEALRAPEYAATEWSAWSHGDHPAARLLAARTGFVRSRELWVMRAEVGAWSQQSSPAASHTSANANDVTIRAYQPTDAAGVIAVNAAAFAHHPEQGAMDAANLAERMAEPWFDPQGLLVAVNGANEVRGFHWTKVHQPTATGEARIGEVYVIGVAPDTHGQGVGRRLMQAGLAHLTAANVDQVLLYVEGDNAPALALYASLGFTHSQQDTHVLYRRAGSP
jgi:mycothiol synthase